MKITIAAILFIAIVYANTDTTSAWGYWPGWGGWGWNRWGWGCGWYNCGGWGGWWYRRSAISDTPKVECTYIESQSLLRCYTPMNGSIDCQAFGRFEQYEAKYLEFYGISALPNGNLSEREFLQYSLYPQLPNGRGWLNSTFFDSVYGNLSYILYYGPENMHYGFRVNDLICWNRLVDLFTGFGQKEPILVGSDEVVQHDILGGIVFS